MFERPRTGERAVLVHPSLHGGSDSEELQEFEDLTASAGACAVAVVVSARKTPDPKYFIGSGKAEEVAACVAAHQAELVLVNHALTPAQERNLERLLKCRVLDRTGLILDIFAQRARSHEGKLQVELAQLQHMSTRLVRGWTHLERQKGGIGLRGPGETQLETDRRLLGHRIKQLRKQLERVDRRRDQGRRARRRADTPTISLVGYTNAGKSTLFNRLTGAGVYAADQLFATLDPTLRRLDLSRSEQVVLADTVGFIRHLPHDLVAAFRSTLQETNEAELLLHVVDSSDENRNANIEQVNAVLKEIGAERIPQLQVYNKIDMVDGASPRVDFAEDGTTQRVWVSAVTGDGIDQLLQAIAAHLRGSPRRRYLRVPPNASRVRAKLYGLGAVLEENTDENGVATLCVELSEAEYERLVHSEGLDRWQVEPPGRRLADEVVAP